MQGTYGDTIFKGNDEVLGEICVIPNNYKRTDHHPDYCLLLRTPRAVAQRALPFGEATSVKDANSAHEETWLEREVRMLLQDLGLIFTPQPAIAFDCDFLLDDFGILIYADGCTWHAHQCQPDRSPDPRYQQRRARDAAIRNRAVQQSYRVVTITRCAIDGPTRLSRSDLETRLMDFVTGDQQTGIIEGHTAV